MKWLGQYVQSLTSRFRSDVYLESISTGTIASGAHLGLDSNNKIVKAVDSSGDLTSIVAGTGLSGTSLTGPIPTLNVDASQTQITSVGTIGTGVWQGTTIKTAYIGDDQVTEDKLANTLLAEIDANTAKVTNVSTNLAITGSTDAKTITSSDGTNAVIPVATTETSGVMSTELFDAVTANTAKATNVTTNLTATTHASQITINSSDGTNVVVAEASGSIAGVMSVTHHDKLDAIEASATADQSKSDIDGLAITTVGTIDTGVWNGTAIASAYLDADTAHLSGSQTFTGTKTLNSFKGTGGATVTNILDEDAMGSNSATALATQQSIKAYADTKVSKDTTRQLTHHTIVDDIDATDVVYISLGEIDAENTTNSNKNLPLLAPVAGKLLKVFVRSSSAMNTVDLTFKLYTRTVSQSTNGAAAEVGAKLMAGPTNKTMVTFDFEDLTTTGASGTNAIATGDKVLLSIESSGATSNSNIFISCLWEWDLS